MAKCSDKERALLDSYFNPTHDSVLEQEVLLERITKEMKNSLIKSSLEFEKARRQLEVVRSQFFSICPGKTMLSIIQDIEQEALSPLK